jgi:hypothetical protein
MIPSRRDFEPGCGPALCWWLAAAAAAAAGLRVRPTVLAGPGGSDSEPESTQPAASHRHGL